MDWLALFLSCFGLFLIARKCIWVWPVWLAACVVWSIYALQSHQPSILILQVVYAILNVYGWLTWVRERNEV